MKSKNKSKGLKKIAVLLLVCTIMATSAFTGFLLPGAGKGPTVSQADSGIVKGGADHSAALENLNEDLVTKTKSIGDGETVYYIIQIGENSLLNMYENRSDKNQSYQDFVSTRSSRINSENMSKKQKAIFSQISKKVDVKFALSLTGMANAFAVSVRYGDRDALKQAAFASGALSVTISERYDQPEAFVEVDNTVPAHDTGIFERPDPTLYPYEGEGMVVAVLDTSLDYTHPAFAPDARHLPSDDNINIKTSELKLSRDDINDILPNLVANGNYKLVQEGRGFDLEPNMYSNKLSITDVWVNDKVPYAYDYADGDPEVNATQENSHGTHVSGIIVGYSDTPWVVDEQGRPIDKDGNVLDPNDPESMKKAQHRYDREGNKLTGIEGVAPRAQIVAMKVFSDFSGGAEDVYLYGALEDCAKLGVDVANLSLGRGSGFSDMEDNPVQRASYKLIDSSGINLITAASNGYSSGMGGHFGANLTTNPDSATVGSPSTMYEAFSVASINGIKSKYIKARALDGTEKAAAYITESNDSGITKLDFITDLTEAINKDNYYGIDYKDDIAYTNTADSKIPIGKQVKYLEGNKISIPFVVIPGYGRDGDYGTRDVEGKIVVVSRGINTFIEKMQVARNKGALGAVVYNNAGGNISMSLDKNEVEFPSCSITMDASVPLIEMGTGVFEIDENLVAGPFMSAFSSWGPLPSLELKPDITGHGGEIYSSYPGNNYNRISGTSMAAPNIAGLMILARQHIQGNPKYAYADENELKTLTYRLMMSTATMPMNEDNNPYSPRKMGAGLANISGMLGTDAYIVTKDTRTQVEQDRTKIELFDDPDRDGVYEMEFTIRNMSTSKTLNYNLKSFAFTEAIASNKKVVAEKAYMFTGETEWWTTDGTTDTKITNGKVSAAPNGDTHVKAKLTLSPDDIKYLEQTNDVLIYDENGEYVRDKNGQLVKETVKIFENGMFVEGFLRLDGVDDEVDLGVPFLGYYGDWNDAPMFEPSIYDVDKDAKNTNKDEEAKLQPQARSLQAYGKFTSDGYDFTLPLGQYLFAVPENIYGDPIYETPYATFERTTMSLSKTALYELYFVAGFLRGAKYANWEIRDKYTGELMDGGQKVNLRKDARASNIGGLQMELDISEIGCKNNGTYVFSFTAILDHYADWELDYTDSWEDLYTKSQGKKESWAFEFTIDTDAPIITDTDLRVEEKITGDGYNYFIDFYLHDDNYIQAMSFNLFHESSNDFVSIWERGLRPIMCEKNGTTRVTYDITGYWEHLVKNGYRISTQLYDYSWNMSYYEINLKDQLHTTAAATLEFGEIGQYREYTRGDSKYKVLESDYDDVIYNADGTYNKMSSIYIVKNQTVNLGNALVVDENAWPESFEWTSGKHDYIRVNSKTGEIFAIANHPTDDIMVDVTVTAFDKDRNIVNEKTINVWVISDQNVADYGINTVNANVKNLSKASFVEVSKTLLKAGESVTVKIEPQPWFGDLDDLRVEWSVLHDFVATVNVRTNKFEAVVTAKQGVINGDDYTPNSTRSTIIKAKVYHKDAPLDGTTAELTIRVLPEFVVNGTHLTAYNGTRANVVIPKSLGIISIADRCFINTSTIETLVLPEGLEVIGQAAFAYCGNLREVKMPSTLRTIGEYAFTGSFTPRDGLNTALQIVDTTACTQPIQVEPKAFVNNPVLGTNMVVKRTSFGKIGPASTDFLRVDSKLDMKNFRVVGEKAFSGAGYLTELNLVNCRTVGEGAFNMFGRSIASTDDTAINLQQRKDTTITLGPRTGSALNSFSQTGVKNLVVPMARIAESAFASSNYLEKVTFTGKNIYIGDAAFRSCPALTTVEFKGDLTTDPSDAYKDLNGTVTYIGKNAFANNGKLETLSFEKAVKHIDDYAFFGAPLAETLTLPVGLEYLGTDAFSGRILTATGSTNSNIETLNIPLNFNTNIENFGAFFDTLFDKITIGGNDSGITTESAAKATALAAEKVQYLLEDGILLKKQIINDVEVTVMVMTPLLKNDFAAVANDVFTVPASVTVLGENAFGFNTNIKEIDLNNVKTAMPGAMQNMKSLEKVTLSDDMTEIPDYMFRGCTSLAEVNNTDQVTSIGKYAFAGNVDTIFVKKSGPDHIEAAEGDAGAFAVTAIEIVPIETIDLSSWVEIGEGAFSATGLTTVALSLGVTEIPAYAFAYTLSLKNVYFNPGVTSIGDFAFYMTGIESMQNGAYTEQLGTIKEIGNSAFAFDEFEIFNRTTGKLVTGLKSSLTVAEFPNATIVGSGAFSTYYGGGALVNVDLSKVEAIGAYAFEYQSELNITDLTKLEVVGNYAFAGSGMKAVNMPKVEYIGTGAFYDCADMSGKVEIPASVKHIGPMAFAYTEITEFSVADSNKNFKTIGGVLFRIFESYKVVDKKVVPNTALELAHYPAGNGRRDINSGIPVGQGGANSLASGVYVVPEGTTRIGENAFTTVRTVSTVVLPSTLTHIGDKAFFGSLVKMYEFKSFKAPILEGGSDNYDHGDLYDYTWAVYANFYNYFSPSSSYYTWTDESVTTKDGDIIDGKSFLYQFRYNTITVKSASTSWVYGEYIYSSDDATPVYVSVPDTDTHNAYFGANHSVTGGGDMTDKYQYGLVIVRPSNGEGYEDFVYKYYFDSVILSAALMTPAAEEVIAMIDALPAASEITLENLSENRIKVTTARNYYNYLTDDVKLLIRNYQKLEECEAAVNQILASIKTYVVVFQVDGAIVGKIQTIENGGKIAMPANPAPATGYAFDGWYFGDQKVDANTTVTQDMVLVARWVIAENYFKVTFNGIGVDIEAQIVEGESLATKPEDPVREGYKFKGWVYENGKFDFNTAITEDINLYAEWEKKGGCGCGSISLADGGTGLVVLIISLAAFLALSAAVLVKKRTISRTASNN